MPLSTKEIQLFATDAFRQGGFKPIDATGAYPAALAEIRASGYRVTRRVRDVVWRELLTIKADEARQMHAIERSRP